LSASNQQASVSQHSASNGSPAHSQNTSSCMDATIGSNDINNINTPPNNFKCSPLPPTGPPMTQPVKPPHLVLPTASCYQPQLSTHSKTPNIIMNESVFSCASQTFPNRLYENQQQQRQQNQYTWGITLNNSNNNSNSDSNSNSNSNNNNTIGTAHINTNNNGILHPISNSQHTPPPPMSGIKSYDTYHTNASPIHSPMSYTYGAQTFTPSTSAGTNSPPIKPNPKSSTLQVATQNNLNTKTSQDVLSSEKQVTSLQQSLQTLQTNDSSILSNTRNANDDVSYYLFGDDLSTNGIKAPINTMFEKQNAEIMLLREQINQLQSQLKLEKEKNQIWCKFIKVMMLLTLKMKLKECNKSNGLKNI